MAAAARLAGVGPMAAVAGAIAGSIGRRLSSSNKEVIVENGGDLYIDTDKPRNVGIYPGRQSPFYGKLSLRIKPDDSPLGLAASSGTLGHSLSFGAADAAVVLARTSVLADAAATALANRVYSQEEEVLAAAGKQIAAIPGVIGHLIIAGGRLEAGGKIDLVRL